MLTSGDFCFHICFNLTHLSSHLAPLIGFSQVGESFETHSPQGRQEANRNGMDRASGEAVVKSFGLSVQKTVGRMMASWGILALSEVAAILSLLQSCRLDIGAPFLLVWYWVAFHSLSFGMRLCRSLGDTHDQLFLCFPQCPQGFLYLSHTSPLCLLFPIRWQQTSKSSGLSSSLQPAGAKADALREEMEESANRVEICRVPSSLLPSTEKDGEALRESLSVGWRSVKALTVSLWLNQRPQACLLTPPKSPA